MWPEGRVWHGVPATAHGHHEPSRRGSGPNYQLRSAQGKPATTRFSRLLRPVCCYCCFFKRRSSTVNLSSVIARSSNVFNLSELFRRANQVVVIPPIDLSGKKIAILTTTETRRPRKCFSSSVIRKTRSDKRRRRVNEICHLCVHHLYAISRMIALLGHRGGRCSRFPELLG